MERYSFPDLAPEDIYTQLKDSLGITISSLEEILRPSPNAIKIIYIQLLQIVFHKQRDDFLLIKSCNPKLNKSVELHDNAISYLNLYKHLTRVLSQIGCKADPLRITDLTTPDPRRTVRFLSAFINFIRFMIEEQELIFVQNPETTLSRVAAEECNKTKEEYERKYAEVQMLKKQNQEKFPIIEQKKVKIDQLGREKEKIENERKKIEKEVKVLEAEAAGLNEAMFYLNNSDTEINQEYSKFRSENEGNCDEEVMEKIKYMEKVINIVKEAKLLVENCEDVKKKCGELENQVSVQKKQAKDLEESIALIKMDLPSFDNIESLASDASLLRLGDLIKEKQTEKTYLLQEKENLEQELVDKRDQLSSLKDQFSSKKAKYQEEIKILETEHSKIIKKAEEYKEKVVSMIKKSQVELENKENYSYSK
ncbi:unnamed protein product [Blepharisma stoltei]|uniref:Kinetochore protein Nuf2 N-terminal domain-containing protein n=1 Tax=Blepharisma stoltei TaxID=1481888 RepID=A0AAU9KN91_9CILI|nr:unnamed protein product [Blepharisma stoltei]